MRWAEWCQCPHHLFLSRVQEEGGRGTKTVRKGGAESSLHHRLISQRRRPLSLYSQSRQHQRRSAWHTAKVIATLGLSLEGTNPCFTWLDGAVQRRRRLRREESLRLASSSERRGKKSCELIWLKCSIYMDAHIWTQQQLLTVTLQLFPPREEPEFKDVIWTRWCELHYLMIQFREKPSKSLIFCAPLMPERSPKFAWTLSCVGF